MVFATLSQRDKEAFFSLLDEYFESRPHLFAGATAPRTTATAPPAPSTTVTAANRTPSRPIPVPSVQHSPPASPPAIKPKSFVPAVPTTRKVTPTPRIVEPPSYTEEHEQENENENENVDAAPVSVASRIAAAQAALGTSNHIGGRPPVPSGNRRVSSTPSVASVGSATSASSAPPPPQRSLTTSNTRNSHNGIKTPPVSAHTTGNSQTNANGGGGGNSPSGLVTSKSIAGTGIDTSSAGSALSSAFSSKKKTTSTYIAPRSAFEKPKTKEMFAPPPSRSPNASQANLHKKEESTPVPVYNSRGHEEEEEDGEEVEEEGEYAKGEWVEALYDFETTEGTDLSFKAGQQIFVTERSSKDWWMAELNGKEGLVPASYVKVL
ncbi:hypothetical protein FRC18_010083 [Serendipita sp. 400]|nr:hypothetical protein FRC18_010083 [Serendipita sp. 400]